MKFFGKSPQKKGYGGSVVFIVVLCRTEATERHVVYRKGKFVSFGGHQLKGDGKNFRFQ